MASLRNQFVKTQAGYLNLLPSSFVSVSQIELYKALNDILMLLHECFYLLKKLVIVLDTVLLVFRKNKWRVKRLHFQVPTFLFLSQAVCYNLSSFFFFSYILAICYKPCIFQRQGNIDMLKYLETSIGPITGTTGLTSKPSSQMFGWNYLATTSKQVVNFENRHPKHVKKGNEFREWD